jgi:hypothetical protein
MTDARIGRLLIASLHQGILETMPMRVEFYEHWLSPTGLREGRMGVAALSAALSFLRKEGEPTYHQVMTRAGQAAAAWTFVGISPLRRGISARLPTAWRVRSALRVARGLVRDTFLDTKLKTWMRRGSAALRLRNSVFCETREVSAEMKCIYYAAAFTHLLALYRVDAEVTIRECKAGGHPHCLLQVEIRGSRAAMPAVEAA